MSIFGYHAQESLADVTDFVVFVEEVDVLFDCWGGGGSKEEEGVLVWEVCLRVCGSGEEGWR